MKPRRKQSVFRWTENDSFLKESILKEIAKKNSKDKLKNTITVNGKVYEIDKDQRLYSSGIDLILHSKDSNSYIGFSGNKIFTLKNGEDLQKILDAEIK